MPDGRMRGQCVGISYCSSERCKAVWDAVAGMRMSGLVCVQSESSERVIASRQQSSKVSRNSLLLGRNILRAIEAHGACCRSLAARLRTFASVQQDTTTRNGSMIVIAVLDGISRMSTDLGDTSGETSESNTAAARPTIAPKSCRKPSKSVGLTPDMDARITQLR